ACAYDFDSQEGYINGDSCSIEIQGCMDNVGVDEMKDDLKVHVFPNPFSNNVFVQSPIDFRIEIFDIHGRLISENHTNSWIESENWINGVYFLKVFGKKKIQIVRVSKS
ncbi:MAG: T9SS type A sorting domain-containing protein, partial [Bacteroidota bacterium]